jgi:hypothetical protein
VFDFDPYSQALSKLERGFELDLEDVHNMVLAKQVRPERPAELYEEIEGQLYRFPSVDRDSLREAVESLEKE